MSIAIRTRVDFEFDLIIRQFDMDLLV